MSKKINLSLFNDFFRSSSPADFAKELIKTSNPDENREIVADTEDRIWNLKDRIKEMIETEKKIKKCEWDTKDY